MRIGGIAGMPVVLRNLGVDPAEVMAEVDVEPSLFDDPDNRIGFAARARLVAHCVARTGCPHLGLLIGQQGSLEDFGVVGLLAKYSPDVGAALGSLVRCFHLHTRGVTLRLTVHDEVATFSYAIDLPQIVATEQFGDGAVAIMFNVMRKFCGPGWTPSEVLLARRRPTDDRPYRRAFQAPLTFGAEHNALVFPARWLDHRLPASDPELERYLRRHIETLESRYESFPDQVRSVLRTALLTHRARADQVAALFSMHSRTLSRHLQACGTSYRDLLDEGRFEFARQMLENTALEVTQIAAALDYADASAFTRAFRRWSGTTPGRWRVARLSRPAR